MKRAISVFLALAFCVPLAACGKDAPLRAARPEPAMSYPALALAVYPEMAPYPDELSYVNQNGDLDEAFYAAHDAWWGEVRARREAAAELDDSGLDGFLEAGIRQFLSGAEGENRVCSPLNVYMALAMLSELTGGESRAQILSLLGSDSIEALRAAAGAVWNANYRDDGVTKSILAASLWLNEDVSFVQSTLDRLAETYYASSYQGEMGSRELDEALQSWLSAQTGGLLDEQAGGVALDADVILALATTVYFRAKWSSEFPESFTEPGTFHAAGGDMTADFMHQGGGDVYYWGEKFSAVAKSLESDGDMLFLLPDEGVTPEELLADGEAMEFLLSGGQDWEKSKFLTVNKSIPKFDVASELDLIPGLKALGVTDVFDSMASDFTPMTTDRDDIYVSKAEHAARAAIDEKGVVAAAYTVIGANGAGIPPEEEIDFILDRPFLFAITGAGGLPLFVGIVNTP